MINSAKQSIAPQGKNGLLRRFAPRNDDVARPSYRIAFADSTSRALVVAVASTVPFSAISRPSTKAMVLPRWVTLASPVVGPGLAGARKFTVMVMVAV